MSSSTVQITDGGAMPGTFELELEMLMYIIGSGGEKKEVQFQLFSNGVVISVRGLERFDSTGASDSFED